MSFREACLARCKYGLTFTCNALLLLIGFGCLIYGIVRNVDTRMKFSEIESARTDRTDGTVNIVIGCFQIAVGVFGLISINVNIRIVTIINTGLLTMALIGYAIFLIVYSVNCANFLKTERLSTAKLFKANYGNTTKYSSRYFTASVNALQQKEGCCGWSGLSGENLYLRTAWFERVNQNTSLYGGRDQTLPESCCTSMGITECKTSENIDAAREKGFVHKMDCSDMIIEDFTQDMWVVISQLVMGMLLQIGCDIFQLIAVVQDIKAKVLK